MSEHGRLRIHGPLRRALCAEELARIPEEALARFLLERRWFGGKGVAPTTVRFRDVIPLFDGTAAITRLDVDEGTERATTYQLPLAARGGDDGTPSPLGTLARLDSDEGPGCLVDGLADAALQARLGDALCDGATFGDDRTEWRIEPIAPHDEARGHARLLGAEQSNTSMAFGERAILKLYRRIAPGKNPDVEIGEFLVRQGRFANVPRLLSTIRFVDDGREDTFAGMLQEFVPSRGDAWSLALERARVEAVDPSPPSTEEFARAARELGAVTRSLHEALASGSGDPDFEPRPATPEDAVAWGEGVARQVKRAGEAVAVKAAASTLSAEARPLARACLEALPQTLAHVRDLAASFARGAGQQIRHHGDYHLGQVLVTERAGFMILDFEGEPARPLAERRRRHSALRDVAGMVRSIDYAAAAAAREPAAAGAAKRLARWQRRARRAFLDGYFGATLPAYLPPTRAEARRLLELFEIEKVFYELVYEVNHRPDWVEIPLRAIASAAEAAR